MDSEKWWLLGALIAAFGGAWYLGTHLSPSAGTVDATTNNTATVNSDNNIVSGEIQDLQIQSQIMNSLNLTPGQTNTASATSTS